jgi:hypothetical protein
MTCVPLNNTTKSFAEAFNAPTVYNCGVLNRDGIFYASLRMQGQDDPLEIALHGIRSESEAQQAFATLAQLRQARCTAPASLS